MNATASLCDQKNTISRIGLELDAHERSLRGIGQTRVDLAIQFAELIDLQRALARRAHLMTMANHRVRTLSGSKGPYRMSRRGRDHRRLASN